MVSSYRLSPSKDPHDCPARPAESCRGVRASVRYTTFSFTLHLTRLSVSVAPAIAPNHSRAGVVVNFVTATGGDVEMLRSIECFYK